MKTCECGYFPTIIIPGIGQSKVDLFSASGKRIKQAWPLDIDAKKIGKKIAPSSLKMLITKKDDEFLSVLKDAVKDALSELSVNSEGVPNTLLRPVDYGRKSIAECKPDERDYIYRMVPMEELSEVIGEDHMYFFSYNSFGQPYETAKDLNDFIEKVKAETGHDKVNIVPVSLGGSIATAYLDAYGDKNDIHRICYFVPATNGSTIVADIFDRNLDLDDPESLFYFLLDGKTTRTLMSLSKFLPENGLKRITETFIEAAWEVLVFNCPGIWALLPKEKYEEERDKYLLGYGKGVLKAKTERYFNAQKKLPELLKKQIKNGVGVFSICGYGLEHYPFTGTKKINCDTIVDFTSASLGGTAVNIGEVLPEDYKCENGNCKNKKHNHISPDRTVDLSTSIIPDNVFCFYRQQHDATAYNDVAMLLAKEILTNDEFKNVYSDSRFPQFNGSRYIRDIKYDLLPRAYNLLHLDLCDNIREDLENAIKQAEDVFKETIIENNDKASAATKTLKEAVDAATPDFRV